MLQTVKKYFLIFVSLLLVSATYAQKVTFEADIPSAVELTNYFRVEFRLNAKPSEFNFTPTSDFDVLAGPSTSQGHSVSIVNGSVTKSESYTITYVLQPKAEGKFTMPSAEAKVDGTTYKTKPVTIEVVGGGNSGSAGGSSGANGESNQGAQQISSGSKLAADDILLRVFVNKSSVFKGQPIKATVKLYSRVQIGIENYKFPAFNGFWTQELDPGQGKWQRETYNNKVYNAVVVKEYLLYPQQSGVLYVEQFDLDVVAQIVVQQTKQQTLLDEFFSGGPDVQTFHKKLTSSPLKITVKDLPAGAPEGFTGAVGNFTMSTEMPSSTLAANSAATYSIKISGAGNLPLIQAPKMNMPTSFEQYNIKTTESLNSSANGISGYRQFEYPFIARAEGEYDIDQVKFSYFNPDQARYITLTTDDLHLNILPDSTGGSNSGGAMISGLTKEDIKILGQDIRFIKIGKAGFMPKNSVFLWSWSYIITSILLIGIFVFLLVYLQKRIKEMRDTALVRGKKANRVALQRLRAAEVYMKASDQRHFYDEMLKALWGYMSDKLNIPVANLTKENVREELLKRNITHDHIARYIETISDCEYAQYSPATNNHMTDIYRTAVELISKFESVIK